MRRRAIRPQIAMNFNFEALTKINVSTVQKTIPLIGVTVTIVGLTNTVIELAMAENTLLDQKGGRTCKRAQSHFGNDGKEKADFMASTAAEEAVSATGSLMFSELSSLKKRFNLIILEIHLLIILGTLEKIQEIHSNLYLEVPDCLLALC
ncbi:hypothetical protein TNCV_2250801 [Trichonephila clavipes]|nr:hypothetical protein TNCV_2250801 [Trichonephila clavipes]